MPSPIYYQRAYNFSPGVPGLQINIELENVEQSVNGTIDALKDVRRDDGALKNGIVTVDSLSPEVAAGVGTGALAAQEAAEAAADAASDSAVAAAASATAASGSATAASGYASDALTSRNEASSFSDDSAAAVSLAQTARDYAYQWASAAEGVDVDDGVNPVNKSAYHWSQVALGAATGALPDGSVDTIKIADGAMTTAKIADGALSADTTGRAKMADGFVTSAKIADGTIATGDIADAAVTAAKLATDIVSGQTSKATVVDADEVLLGDSAASGAKKRAALSALWTWAQAKVLALLNASGSAPVYAIRAWANFNGSGTVTARQAGNVATITRSSTGVFDVVFVTAMPDADYVVAPVGGASSIDTTVSVGNQTASGFRMYVVTAGVASDQPNIGFVVCR